MRRKALALLRGFVRRRRGARQELSDYRAIFEGAQDTFMVLSQERFLDCNPSTLAMFGFGTKEAFVATHPADLSPATQPDGSDSWNSANHHIHTALREGGHRFEWVHRRLDGSEFPAEVVLSPLELAGGVVLLATVRDITERKRVQAALRHSEARFQGLLQQMNEGMVVLDAGQRIIDVNPRMAQIIGVPVSGLLEQPWTDFLDPEVVPFFETRMALRRLGISERYELPIRRPDGASRLLGVSGNPLRDAQGQVIGAYAIMSDITEQKRAEEALKASEERFRLLFQQGPVGILFYDPQGVLVDCNERFANFLGSTRERLLGLRLLEVVQNPEVVHALREALEGRPGVFEGEYRSLTGNRRPVGRLLTFQIRGEDGRDLGAFGIAEDYSARREAEDRYLALFENALEGMYEVTPEGQILKVNPSVLKLLGFDSLEDFRKGTDANVKRDYVDPSRREVFRERLERDGRVTNFEFEAYRKDGSTIWLSDSAYLIRDDDGKPKIYAGFLQDITVKKQSEELRLGKEAAEAASQAKSAFLAHLSHEIRTPLNAILGFSELLRGKVTDPQAQKHLAALVTSGQMLLGLLQDILDLSRLEANRLELQPEPLDPALMLQEMGQVFSLRCEEKGIALKLSANPDLPRSLLLDQTRFRQILFNLLGNAIKFTEAGTVEAHLDMRVFRAAPGDLELQLTVQDTGIGIPADQQERIFQPFLQQLDQDSRKYGGSGLGLSITLRLVELMGGRINLCSQPGEGSTFTVRLPVQVAAAPLQPPPKAHPAPAPQRRAEKPEPVPAELRARLPELLERLDQAQSEGVTPGHGLVFPRLEAFGLRLAELGRDYGVATLSDWAQHFLEQVRDFDVEGITRSLHRYPDLLATLKALGEDPDRDR